MLLLQIFFEALFLSFWYSSYTVLCIKIVSQLLNVLLCFYFFILFCLCISTLYVVLFSYSHSLIISSETYLCVVNKYLFFISTVVFFPTPGDLPNPGIELASLESPALAGRVFITAPPGTPFNFQNLSVCFLSVSFFLS